MDEIEIRMPREALRRMLNITRTSLTKCREVEGREFPKSDRDVLDLVNRVAFEHKLY